jgi:hypothetical protein
MKLGFWTAPFSWRCFFILFSHPNTLHYPAYRASLVCGGSRNHLAMKFAGVSMQRGLGAKLFVLILRFSRWKEEEYD